MESRLAVRLCRGYNRSKRPVSYRSTTLSNGEVLRYLAVPKVGLLEKRRQMPERKSLPHLSDLLQHLYEQVIKAEGTRDQEVHRTAAERALKDPVFQSARVCPGKDRQRVLLSDPGMLPRNAKKRWRKLAYARRNLELVRDGTLTVSDLRSHRRALNLLTQYYPALTVWALVVSRLNKRFTTTLSDMYGLGDFEDHLRAYCGGEYQISFDERSAFKTEIARLHETGTREQLLGEIWEGLSSEAKAIGLPVLFEPSHKKQINPADHSGRHTAEMSKAREGDPADQWVSATRAAEIGNNLTSVNRDWSSFWRGFCNKYGVHTRPGKKKDGTATDARRQVEVGSLVRTIIEHSDSFQGGRKRDTEHEKRRQEIRERVRKRYDIIPEIRRDIEDGR